MSKRAIIVLSGGLDSCVTTAIALSQGYELGLLHLNYGQRTEARELKAFNDIADYYKISKKLVVDINYLREIGGSALTDNNISVEKGDLARTTPPSTYVPFRNANILSIATSWAEVLKAEKIFIGAVDEDSSGYPDCKKVFFDKFNDLLSVAIDNGTKLRVETPVIDMKKSEIVKAGLELSAPLNLTWSCYKNEESACGECDSCLLRLRGFSEAGFTDPIKYVKR